MRNDLLFFHENWSWPLFTTREIWLGGLKLADRPSAGRGKSFQRTSSLSHGKSPCMLKQVFRKLEWHHVASQLRWPLASTTHFDLDNTLSTPCLPPPAPCLPHAFLDGIQLVTSATPRILDFRRMFEINWFDSEIFWKHSLQLFFRKGSKI